MVALRTQVNAGVNATTLTERLRANLAAQTTNASELETLLSQERERLIARDWEAVLHLSEHKERLIVRLSAQGRELAQLAAGDAINTVLDANGLSSMQAALHEQAARLQRANRESRALLDHHQSRVGTALRLLQRGDGAGTYGRSGFSGNGRLSMKLAQA